jgi:hypothetical protein
VSNAVGVKMEPVRVNARKVISSGKGKDLTFIKGFKFRFQKNLLTIWNDGKCYIKCNESPQIPPLPPGWGVRGSVVHNHDEDSEANLNRDIK